jgi:hypothetical protein
LISAYFSYSVVSLVLPSSLGSNLKDPYIERKENVYISGLGEEQSWAQDPWFSF